MKKANIHNEKLDFRRTEKAQRNDSVSSTPQISFEEAQALINNVITHINTGRGRIWSKMTAA